MQQRLAIEIKVDKRRRASDRPEAQPREHELWRILQVESDELTGPHADGEEVPRVPTRLVVRFLPCVLAGAAPYRASRWIAGDGVGEEIPQGLPIPIDCSRRKINCLAFRNDGAGLGDEKQEMGGILASA